MTQQTRHNDATMAARYADLATKRLGYRVRFVGWIKQHPSGATEPRFAVDRAHLLDAQKHGLCVQIEWP